MNHRPSHPAQTFFHALFYPEGSDKYGGSLEFPKGISSKRRSLPNRRHAIRLPRPADFDLQTLARLPAHELPAER